MNNETRFRSLLKEAQALHAQGLFDEARNILDQVRAESAKSSGTEGMGPLTMMGLPRRLHSANLKLAKAQGDIVRKIGLQYSLVPDPQLLARFGEFTAAERKQMAQLNREPVPRILHQIWLGNLEVPPATVAWAEHCKKHGFEYKLWREADLKHFGIEEHPAFVEMLKNGDYPGAVDVARYFVLEAVGGIYLDCDWYPAHDGLSLADVLPLMGLSALAEDTPRNTGVGSLMLTNSYIAAPKGHPVFTCILKALPEVVQILPGAPAWWSTGPLIFTVISRGTSFSIPDASFVAGILPRKAPFSDVEAIRTKSMKTDSGLLVGWKSW